MVGVQQACLCETAFSLPEIFAVPLVPCEVHLTLWKKKNLFTSRKRNAQPLAYPFNRKIYNSSGFAT